MAILHCQFLPKALCGGGSYSVKRFLHASSQEIYGAVMQAGIVQCKKSNQKMYVLAAFATRIVSAKLTAAPKHKKPAVWRLVTLRDDE